MVPEKPINRDIDEQVRVKDSDSKFRMKLAADTKNRANERNINVGDTVLIERDISGNKLEPKFDHEPKS